VRNYNYSASRNCLIQKQIYIFLYLHIFIGESGSSDGIATELRAGRSEIECRWGRYFPPVQTGPGAHPASCKMGTGSFPGVKCGRSVLLITNPLLVPRSWKSRAINLPTLWAKIGPATGLFYLYIYLYISYCQFDR